LLLPSIAGYASSSDALFLEHICAFEKMKRLNYHTFKALPKIANKRTKSKKPSDNLIAGFFGA
jgi:hypothetical protein